MGACYSVRFTGELKDEKSAIKAMRSLIKRSENVDFNLDKHKKRGLGLDNFNNLLRVFLSGCSNPPQPIINDNGYIYYSDNFDASYGWETVMVNMFEEIAPYLKNGSQLDIYPDNEHIVYGIENGQIKGGRLVLEY